MQRLTLARDAMATRFEFVLAGGDPARLRAAGEEALDEIQRIESRLSLYRSGSEVAEINRRAGAEPVRLSPEVFTLLERAREFHQLTGGSLDPTVGPLVRCWGFMKGIGEPPAPDQIAAARALVGMEQVHLDRTAWTVRFARPGMMLDLGSLGKGYALDCAAEVLREAGVEQALLHGGTSTIVALGEDPAGGGWKVAIEKPGAPDEKSILAVVELTDQSLSVSAVWGKFFEVNGKKFGHVIDPRTGWPVENALLGAVVRESGLSTDALSTAILLADQSELRTLSEKLPGLRYLQLRSPETGPEIEASGIDLAQN